MKQFLKFSLAALALFSGLQVVAQVPKPSDPRQIRDVRPDKTSSGTDAATSGQSSKTPTSSSGGVGGTTFMKEVVKAGNETPINTDLVKKYAESITAEDMEALLSFIASDELEGRETGTRGQKVAARYLATQFQKMGLKPGNSGKWYQEYKLRRLSVKSASISLTGKDRLEFAKDFICFNKTSLAKSFEADYVFAGFGIADDEYDNLKGLDLKDKVAVVFAGEPKIKDSYVLTNSDQPSDWSSSPDMKLKALAKKGVRAVLVAFDDEQMATLVKNPGMKHMMNGSSLTLAYLQEKDPSVPAFYISETMMNQLLKKGKTSVEAQRKALSVKAEVAPVDLSKVKFNLTAVVEDEEIIAENVLGMIEGTDKKEEVVILTAHYDHLGVHDGEIFNGADDDGTGTVALLEVAEAFMEAVKEGNRPRRTILFMPVSGEEKGLLGSKFYSDHPVYPIQKTVCDLNIDMIGRVDEAHKGEPQYIYIIGSDKLSSQLHVANENANKVVGNLELDYTFNSPDDPNRFYYRSDHYNFAKHGIPVIFYFSGVHEDYHKSTDDIEKILFPRAARVAQLVFATAWDVANRDMKLVVDKSNDFPSNR